MNSETKKHEIDQTQGAKQLLYEVENKEYDFDSLMELLKNQPSLMMSAEKIFYLDPLGFIVKNRNGEIIDYLKIHDEDLEIYISIYSEQTCHISSLLGTPGIYPNYSDDFHFEIINAEQRREKELMGEAPLETNKLTFLTRDTFIYDQLLIDAPIVLRKGSIIPTLLLQRSSLVFEGKRKDLEDMQSFLLLIDNYKTTNHG